MTVTSFFMLHVATALLPPHDEIDYEYYTVLNLPKKSSVTVAQIRKAYKLLSLQLHPDKITQKQRLNGNNNNAAGTMSVEEAAQLYEKVQEAVNVLSDDQKRRVYINYNYSVARYKFVMREDSSSSSSQNFMENILRNMLLSSCYNRTKLWLFVVLFITLLLLLQPVLIAMKVNAITGSTLINNNNKNSNLANTSWFLILLPFWIFYSGYTAMHLVLVVWKSVRERLRYGPPQTNLPKITYWSLLGMVNDIYEVEEEEEEDDEEGNYNNHDATGGTNPDPVATKIQNGSTISNSELVLQFFNGIAIPVTIVVGLVLLILQWENNSSSRSEGDTDNTNWIHVAIPFYGTIVFIILRNVISLQQIRYVQSCMISSTHSILVDVATGDVDNNGFRPVDSAPDINNNNTISGLSKKKMIKQNYLVVQPDPEKLQIALAVVRQMKMTLPDNDDLAITDDEMEYIRVQCSDEHDIMERMKKEYYQSITTFVLIHVTQLTLILCQIQHTISAKSWYIVFLPLLIHIGLPLLRCSCYYRSGMSSDDTDDYNNDDDHHRDNGPPSTATANHADGAATNHSGSHDIVDIENDIDIPAVDPSDPVLVSTTTPLENTTTTTSTSNEENHWNVPNISNPPTMDATTTGTTATTESTSKSTSNDNQPNNTSSSSPRPPSSPPEEENDHDGSYMKLDYDEHERDQRGPACCFLVMLILIIAKLEQSYPADNNDNDDDGSFNAMWILFPLFLLSGCIVLLLTCCICMPSTPRPEPESNGVTTNINVGTTTTTEHDNVTTPSGEATFIIPQQPDSHNIPNTENNIQPPIMIIPPPATTTITESVDPLNVSTVAGKVVDVEVGENLHDLD
jgi:DnaJ domain